MMNETYDDRADMALQKRLIAEGVRGDAWEVAAQAPYETGEWVDATMRAIDADNWAYDAWCVEGIVIRNPDA